MNMAKPPFTSAQLPGLRYYDEFLTPEQEQSLLNAIHSHPKAWKTLHNRTLQNWGGLPHIKGMLPTPLPSFLPPLLSLLKPQFPDPPNHVLINRYLPGQGITPHEDGPCYKPIAAIVSLSAPLVMEFSTKDSTAIASLLLRARSLLVLQGAAYTDMFHGIAERSVDVIDSKVLNAHPSEYGHLQRQDRISLTVRTSCKTLRNPLRF